MKKISFKLAKELSEEKWKYITNNNGSTDGLLDKLPMLENMACNCAMCEFTVGMKDLDCRSCVYNTTCDTFYQKWFESRNSISANRVLEAIQNVNKTTNRFKPVTAK